MCKRTCSGTRGGVASRGYLGVGEAVGLLREEYPGAGELVSGLGEYFMERVQYEAVLLRTAGGKQERVEMVARYGQVEFRRPYGESYLETRSAAKARGEIRRLSGEGYAVVHQVATMGIVSGEVYFPSR